MNMKKEYRDELRRLTTAERKLQRDLTRFHRQSMQQIKSIERARARAKMATSREMLRIVRRRAILQGRLS